MKRWLMRCFRNLVGSAVFLCSLQATAQTGEGPPADPGSFTADGVDAAPEQEQRRQSARAAYQEGDAHYVAGDWAGAYEKYKQAHELVPSVNAAYWIAVCLDRLERSFDAALAYAELLRSADVAKLGEQRVADVRARYDVLTATAVSRLQLATHPPARISVDGEPRGETPVDLLLPPGRHELLLEVAGYETEKVEVALAPGKVLDETLELKPVAPPAPPPAPVVAPPPPPPAPAPERSLVPGYVVLGLTAVALGTGTYFGIRALNAEQKFEDDPNPDDADDAEKFQMLSDLSFGAALTLGVTTLVYFLSDGAGSDRKSTTARGPRRLHLGTAASRHGAGAAATLSF